MSISIWLRSPTLRRGIALSAVVLATGGLVLHRSSASALTSSRSYAYGSGKNASTFSGPGVHGAVALSHTKVVAGEAVYAEVRLAADREVRTAAKERAPIAMAVVIDTSGSMSGDKIEGAKRSVLRLIDDMKDFDRIAVIRYSDDAEVLQPLASLGEVRSQLRERVRGLSAGGGTNIPSGLARGLEAFRHATEGGDLVRRVVLVSDGLDGTRQQAESLARSAFASGVTISSLGVGLDFDESYMGAIATSGHGNFAFVNDGSSIATFLQRELEETASTTVQAAKVRLRLPEGLRFVAATGADATSNGDEVMLSMGSLFAGDERRVIVELAARDVHAGESVGSLAATASWRLVGSSDTSEAKASPLTVVGTADRAASAAGQDPAVLATVTSVLASRRQIEAAEAYSKGDVRRADTLAAENLRSLRAAAVAAPRPAAASLEKQIAEVERAQSGFRAFAPESSGGKAAAKSVVAKEQSNAARSAY
jgi:Ca-activated chloride channel family protein